MANDQLFANNVSLVITEFLTQNDTQISVANTDGLEVIANGDFYIATISPVGGIGSLEIIKIVGVNGNTLTVERGLEGTSPQNFLYGSLLELRITAGTLAGKYGGFGTFTQVGIGALEQTIQNKLEDIVTVGDFPTAQLGANAAHGKPFFVPLNSTVEVAVPAQRPDIASALVAIAQWSIPATSLVIIRVAAGKYETNSTIVVDHRDGENILITGPETVLTTTATGINGTAGTRGNYIVNLAVISSAAFVVGSWVGIEATAGTGKHKVLQGFYEVVEVGANSITVRVRAWENTFPGMTLTSANIYHVQAIVKTYNTDSLVVRSSSTSVYNIGFVGNMWDYWLEANILGTEKGTHGVYVCSNTIVDGTGNPGGANPYALSGGGLSSRRVYVADFDQQGFTCANSSGIYGRNLWAASCGRRGFYVGTASAIEARFSGASVNYRDGVIADYGGTFNTSGFESSGNRLDGIFANNGGGAVMVNTNSTANLGYGSEARAGSYLTMDGTSVLTLNAQGGCHFEYGAAGSLSGTTVTANSLDGVSIFYGANVRATNATITNNARYGINALSSTIRYAAATLTGNGTANINNEASLVSDGTNFFPIKGNVPTLGTDVVNAANTNTVRYSVSGIGDYLLSFNGTLQYQFKANALNPALDNDKTLGTLSQRWSSIYGERIRSGPGTAFYTSGTGTPEGTVAAAIGSVYGRLDGGAGTTLYVKEGGGTGNTGWIAK